MVPRADIPRSKFNIQSALKTTFDGAWLVPIYVDEVLPGDAFNLRMTAFCRLATPTTPVMDNLHMDTFWFFVPNRLVWNNWQKFQGEQTNPGDSISYVTPQQVSPASGYLKNSLQDYMGLPTVGQVAGGATVTHSALPLRAYNLIYNEWFRDENLQNSVTVDKGDGPDAVANYTLKKRGKRHDYFTSALPGHKKEQALVSSGNKRTSRQHRSRTNMGSTRWSYKSTHTNKRKPSRQLEFQRISEWKRTLGVTGLQADLSTATAATINQLRQSFQIQKLLERDARGGTRYTEILKSHWGVTSPDARLQRPEYLGGGSTLVNINPIAQTGPTGTTGASTPLGNLAAMGTVLKQSDGFNQAFTEHGTIIGLANVRADLTYQQGLRRMWSRSTRYDYYMPVFAMLGEQSILNKEIYVRGDGNDNNVFGYQERWAEYRFRPSMITGLFRGTTTPTLDFWHYAQKSLHYQH